MRDNKYHHAPDRYINYGPGVRQRYVYPTSKARYWVWIAATSGMICFICYITNFMEKCRAGLCFYSVWFKLCTLSFLIALAISGFLLYQTRSCQRERPQFIWENYRIFAILAILFCLVSICFFSVAIYPVYHEAYMAFDCLALLLFTNLGCVLLYD